MYTTVLVIHIIASFVLVGVILLQAGKGGGLAQTFGGGASGSTLFGQKTSVLLTRATTISAVLFLCTSLSLAMISGRRAKSLMQRLKIAPIAATQQPIMPQKAIPGTKTVTKYERNLETGEMEVAEETTAPLTKEDMESTKKDLEMPVKELDNVK